VNAAAKVAVALDPAKRLAPDARGELATLRECGAELAMRALEFITRAIGNRALQRRDLLVDALRKFARDFALDFADARDQTFHLFERR
jgi:hypothetical protein